MKSYDIIKILDGFNANKSIKFGVRPCPSGYVLYLNNYSDGKMIRISTKLRLTGTDKEYDMSVLKQASLDRDMKEIDLLNGKSVVLRKSNITLTAYVQDKSQRISNFEYHTMSIRLLVRFLKTDKKVTDLSEQEIESFLSSLNVSNTTKHHYLQSIKRILNLAVKDKIITENVANEIHIRCDTVKREFLDTDELSRINKYGKCNNDMIKKAFLFSCFTGLRKSDIYNLKWTDIVDDFLYIRQLKTKETIRMKLSQSALDIINSIERISKSVFILPTYKYVRIELKELLKSSDIYKKITFHCARHTFATLLLTYDTDIYTVSKLLGHRSVNTTAIYAKLIDSKKDSAIDRLPKI